MIRDVGRLVLQKAGYRVLMAADGRQAVDLYRREHARIDLVILDLTMPHLSGRDTLRELVAINPRVRALVTSGYSAEDKLPIGVTGVAGFIPKPYRLDELLQVVRTVLDRAKTVPSPATS